MVIAAGSYPAGRWFESDRRYQKRPHGQAVKTSPFHGGNPSSSLGGVTKQREAALSERFFHRRITPHGGLAQLVRALALQARGHRFKSGSLHQKPTKQWAFSLSRKVPFLWFDPKIRVKWCQNWCQEMVSKFGIPFPKDIFNIFLRHSGTKVGINIVRHPRCRMSHMVLALFVWNAQDKEVGRKGVPQAVIRNIFNSQLAAEPLQSFAKTLVIEAVKRCRESP